MNVKEVLHEAIGPHEGRELELMLKGQKPAAMVGIIDDYKPYIKSKKLVLVSKGKGFDNTLLHFITIPGEEWRGRMLKNLMGELTQMSPYEKEAMPYHAKIGLLLGYSKEDVKEFLKSAFL